MNHTTRVSTETFRLVLLISCAHALVHVYEQAFPGVEQLVAAEFHTTKAWMGYLGNTWRLPFGLGAFAAGWLVDRFGAKWLLIAYLLGCSAVCLAVGGVTSLGAMFVLMFVMGSFASIYHPAGLALISHSVPVHQRPRALGLHGVMGSLGIALGPLVAGLFLAVLPWRGYYAVLAVPGVLLALVFFRKLDNQKHRTPKAAQSHEPHSGHWGAFALLVFSGSVGGIIYAAYLNFLPRYFDPVAEYLPGLERASLRNFVASGVLVVGMLGQYLAGRLGRAGRLERQLAAILLVLVPLLLAMGVAPPLWRPLAAGAVSLVLFMQQPIYNSLVAQFVPPHRRSFGYGISNTLTFGVGSFGATLSGLMPTDWANFLALALLALASAAVLGVLLWWQNGPRKIPPA